MKAKMKKLISVAVFTLLISGCSSTVDKTDEVVKIGKDTFQLSGYARSWKLNELLLSASKFCSKINKELLIKSNETAPRVSGGTRVDTITFLCLDSNDSRYIEASPETKADITIESTIK